MIFYGLIGMLVIGVLLTTTGHAGLVFSNTFSDLAKIEVELMKKDGKFEGEPDYMKDFRVARSEYDLEYHSKHIRYSKIKKQMIDSYLEEKYVPEFIELVDQRIIERNISNVIYSIYTDIKRESVVVQSLDNTIEKIKNIVQNN